MRVFCQWAQKTGEPKIIEVLPHDTWDSILKEKLIKRMAKIMNLFNWQQCKVKLTHNYESRNMSIPY